MKVDLIKHKDCRLYKEWKEYCLLNTESAVLDLRGFESVDEYVQQSLNATARNRYNYSLRNNYRSHEITWTDRNLFLDDIHAVNNSAEIRQGNPMKDAYKEYPKPQSDSDTCTSHFSKCIACFNNEGKLVAYITGHFCGELAASSQIMGHADFLKDGVMINCWVAFVKSALNYKIKAIAYSRWTDGFDGLRYWKHSVGMRADIISAK